MEDKGNSAEEVLIKIEKVLLGACVSLGKADRQEIKEILSEASRAAYAHGLRKAAEIADNSECKQCASEYGPGENKDKIDCDEIAEALRSEAARMEGA